MSSEYGSVLNGSLPKLLEFDWKGLDPNITILTVVCAFSKEVVEGVRESPLLELTEIAKGLSQVERHKWLSVFGQIAKTQVD
ncbi:MAG: hypothetical protein M3P33_00430 [bacterium]|nr:hypothetical protein [bacterium]